MATWISRGMDKFLCEDMGLNSLSLIENVKFVNSGEDIYRVEFHENRLRIWKYNIRENLPWIELDSVNCEWPHDGREMQIEKILLYDGFITPIFGRTQTGLVNDDYYVQIVYEIAKNAWTTRKNKIVEKKLQIQARQDDRKFGAQVRDRYYVYSTLVQRRSLGIDSWRPPWSADPIEFPIAVQVLDLSSQALEVIETTSVELQNIDIHHFLGSIPVAGPEGNSLYLINSTLMSRIYKLDVDTKEWSKIVPTGIFPAHGRLTRAISHGGFVYAFCFYVPTVEWELDGAQPQEVLGLFRLSAEHEWERVPMNGTPPSTRSDAVLLAVDNRLIILGGYGRKSLCGQRRESGFWFHRNDVDLRCVCAFCEEEILPEKNTSTSGVTTADENWVRLVALNSTSNEFKQMLDTMDYVPHLTNRERSSVPCVFEHWQRRKDILASYKFYDIHVLDLSPSLQTLTLVKIADSEELDPALFPRNLHLNLNTMYAFVAKGFLRRLSEEEVKMLVHGKVDFRKDQVRALMIEGAYDGNKVRAFIRKIAERRTDWSKV